MVEIIDEDEAKSLTKSSGRKGKRLESFRMAAEEKGKIVPDLLNENDDGEMEVEGIMVSHEDYKDLCKENDALPDKLLTQGVKSGATNRYDVEFGYKLDGETGEFMVIPNNDKFNGVMAEAQAAVDEQFNAEEDEEDPEEAEAESESDEEEDEEDEE